jgi:colanic acid/amylovoran biosynthesis glycosyltransferase
MTLAYIVSRFPVVTETFILREIVSLQQAGWPVEVFALRHMRERVTQVEAAHLDPDVHFPRAASSLLGMMQRDRAKIREWVHVIVSGHGTCVRAQARALFVLPVALAWARQMHQSGVRHIHAHFGSFPTLAAMIAADRQGIGFSFTVHAHDLFADNQMLAEKTRRARFVVAISEFNRDRIADLLEPTHAKHIRVIHCGVDTDAFAFRALPAEPKPHRILAVAALREYKGLRHLVEACRLLRCAAPDTPFVCHIVGDGPERHALERQIEGSGLRSHVRLEGAVDEEGVREFLGNSDTFVLPSIVARNGYMDGIPVALMEAMACGVPVIASRLSGIPELVRDADTGLLVPPGSAAAVCEAILRTWSEPSLAKLRARRARLLIEREYNLRNTSRQLADAFADAFSRR